MYPAPSVGGGAGHKWWGQSYEKEGGGPAGTPPPPAFCCTRVCRNIAKKVLDEKTQDRWTSICLGNGLLFNHCVKSLRFKGQKDPEKSVSWSESESHSVVSDSLWPHGLYSPGNSPGQDTGVGSLSLLQGVFPTQEWNQGLLYCRQILYQLS